MPTIVHLYAGKLGTESVALSRLLVPRPSLESPCASWPTKHQSTNQKNGVQLMWMSKLLCVVAHISNKIDHLPATLDLGE